MIAIGLAIATAAGTGLGPWLVEWYRNKNQKESDLLKYSKEKKSLRQDKIIEYLESVNSYLELMDIDTDSENSKKEELIRLKNKAFRIKIRVLSLFPSQNAWNFFSIEAFSIEDKDLEEVLINCIEETQKLLDKSNVPYHDIIFYSKISSLLLSDYLNNDNKISEKTLRNVEDLRRDYTKYQESVSDSNDEKFSISIESEESIDEYYSRVFEYLQNKFPNFSKDIKGYSGRLSFDDNVTWKKKKIIVLAPCSDSRQIVLNTNIKRSDAEDFIVKLVQEIEQN